jgi:predicted secreted protein
VRHLPDSPRRPLIKKFIGVRGMKSKSHQDRRAEIIAELDRLIKEQAEYFRKCAQSAQTAEETRRYEVSRLRMSSLFAEWDRLRAA